MLALTGCGQKKAEVSGAVTLDDQPVEAGTITFSPVDGKTSTEGGAIKDGRYSVQVPPGIFKVAISAPKVDPKLPPGPAANASAQETIPAKYNRNSELELEVKSGKNQRDFGLKKE